MPDVTLLSVFLVGLLGGVHCAGMCGGIVAVLGAGARPRARGNPSTVIAIRPARAGTAWPVLIGYNAGRILSYTIAGALAGALGSTAALVQNVLPVQQAAFVLANLLLISMGLYLTGVLGSVAPLEAAGRGVWRLIGPLATRALHADNFARAVGAGMLWGWVPCGMVYGMLIAALVGGSATGGAALMLAFGAGTLPNLLALGWSANAARRWLGRRALRVAAGVLVIGFGVAGLARIDPLAHLHQVVDACLSILR